MSHEAESEHELLTIPPQGSYISLPNSDDAHDDESGVKDQPSTESHARIRSLLRHFRLQIFASILARFNSARWNADTEHRKVAMHQDRMIAAAHSLLHLVPLAGAAILLVFQWTSYWVSYTNDYSTALQFAAKFHELAMQASLTEVLLCAIRTSFVNGIVPLGALSGALQPTQLSYLWSLDFLSIVRTRALERWKKIMLPIAIPVLIGLMAVVGPSSAVLMIPRPNSPSIARNEISFANASVDALYPSRVDLAKGPILELSRFEEALRYGPTYDQKDLRFENVYEGIEGRIYQDYNSSTYDRLVWVSFRRRDSDLDFYDSNATVPTAFATDRLLLKKANEPFRNSFVNNATIEVAAPHAVVSVKCNESIQRKHIRSNSRLPYQKDDGHSTGELPELRSLLEILSDFEFEPGVGSASRRMYFTPVYVPSPELGSHSSVALLFETNQENEFNFTLQQSDVLPWVLDQLDLENHTLGLTVCTISAYWNTGKVRLVEGARPNGVVMTDSSSFSVQTNPTNITLNFTGDDVLCSAAFNRFLSTVILEADLRMTAAFALFVALKISSVPGGVPSMPIQVSSKPTSSNSTPYEFTIVEYGFGYGTRSTSIYLAIAVLSTYCAITISYIIYTLITGSVSTAWNSGIELLTLALQSRKPDHLGHTSVGISSMKTFAEGVGVRVNKHNELEIVFANDRDFGTGALTKIVRNKEY